MTGNTAPDPITRLNAALPAAGAVAEPTVPVTHGFPETLARLEEGN
jgi:hypothetical protein